MKNLFLINMHPCKVTCVGAPNVSGVSLDVVHAVGFECAKPYQVVQELNIDSNGCHWNDTRCRFQSLQTCERSSEMANCSTHPSILVDEPDPVQGIVLDYLLYA